MTPAQKRLTALGIFLGSAVLALRRSGRSGGPCSPDELAGLRYVTRYAAGAKPDQALPLVVFLHSRGAKPEGFTSFANRVKVPARVLFPGGPHVNDGRHSWMTLGSITKQTDEYRRQLRESGAQLAQFISDAQRCYPTIGRPVVTGTSQGGIMTYYMVSQYPELVRGGVAIAGWLPETERNIHMAPTAAAHGTQDTTVPYARTEAMWQELKSAGAPLETRTFNVGHTTSGMGSWWGARVNDLLGAVA